MLVTAGAGTVAAGTRWWTELVFVGVGWESGRRADEGRRGLAELGRGRGVEVFGWGLEMGRGLAVGMWLLVVRRFWPVVRWWSAAGTGHRTGGRPIGLENVG